MLGGKWEAPWAKVKGYCFEEGASSGIQSPDKSPLGVFFGGTWSRACSTAVPWGCAVGPSGDCGLPKSLPWACSTHALHLCSPLRQIHREPWGRPQHVLQHHHQGEVALPHHARYPEVVGQWQHTHLDHSPEAGKMALPTGKLGPCWGIHSRLTHPCLLG